MRLLTVLAMAGGGVLAGIGFTGSYSALAGLAHDHGFGWFSHVFPVGVDAGIVVLLALDLHLIRRGTPWSVVRLVAHLLTVATVVFNASAAAAPIGEDPVGAAMHGVLPVLFVVAVEAGRRLVIKAADIEAGRESAGVPLHRWMLAPGPSWRMYRRMRLWNIPSYTQAVALDRAQIVYRVMLDRRYGSWRKAPSDARLPLTMARYGLTVDEALALPEEAEDAEQQRAQDAALRAERRAADAEIARLKAQGEIEGARLVVDAETGVAGARARAAVVAAAATADAAARTAAAEADAALDVAAAEARLRVAEADRAAVEVETAVAEARAAAAETERAAAVVEADAAEARARVVRADLAAAEDEQTIVEARKRVAEVETAVAEARAAAAEAELRAVEAEDASKLTPRERGARKVARMILADGTGNPEQIELQTIADALGVSVTTASERRREAVELIRTGYRS